VFHFCKCEFLRAVNYRAVPKLGFTKLPPEEEAICVRVREVREDNQMSQADFAVSLGITRDRVASLEYARAPLRWDMGSKLCEIYKRSQRWLAEGKLPKHGPWLILKPFVEPLPDDLFSVGYGKVAPGVIRTMETAARVFEMPIELLDLLPFAIARPSSKAEIAASYRSLLPELISHDLRGIPDDLVPVVCNMIIAQSRDVRMRAMDPKLAEEWRKKLSGTQFLFGQGKLPLYAISPAEVARLVTEFNERVERWPAEMEEMKKQGLAFTAARRKKAREGQAENPGKNEAAPEG